MKVLGVALDLEGTIVDVEEAHHAGHLAAAKEVGLDWSFQDAISKLPSFVGGGDEAIAKEMSLATGHEFSASEILSRLKHHYSRFLSEITIRPRTGFIRCFDQLREARIPIAVGSLTPRADGIDLVHRAGLAESLQECPMVFREEVSFPKPDPEVFLRTAMALHIQPEAQLVFEDSPPGVTAAVAAGSFAVAVPAIHSSELNTNLLKAGARQIFPSWEAIDIDSLLIECLLY